MVQLLSVWSNKIERWRVKWQTISLWRTENGKRLGGPSAQRLAYQVEAMVEKVKISHGPVFNILHGILNMTKVSARWVLWLLTPIQKTCWTRAAVEMLRLCQPNPDDDFFSCLITINECWVYHYDHETKEQSSSGNMWIHDRWKRLQPNHHQARWCWVFFGTAMVWY